MQSAGLRSTQLVSDPLSLGWCHSKVLESSGSSLPHMVGSGASAGAGAGTLTGVCPGGCSVPGAHVERWPGGETGQKLHHLYDPWSSQQ